MAATTLLLATLLGAARALQLAPFGSAHRAPRASPCLVTYADFIKEIRTFKAALRRALAEEAGVPSEETMACIEALASVNPSAPDPAKDDDLWAGEFELLSACLPSAAGLDVALGGAATLNASSFAVALELRRPGCADAAATLALSGMLAAKGKTALSATVERCTLESQDDDVLTSCLAVSPTLLPGLDFGGGPRDSALHGSGGGTLTLGIMYLDQDLHILSPVVADGAAPVVLARVDKAPGSELS